METLLGFTANKTSNKINNKSSAWLINFRN